MKKLVLLVVGFVLMQSVHADEFAKLRMKISGATKGNSNYYLCVGGVGGCISIAAGNKGQTFPMSDSKINYIYATNVNNLRLYAQNLPASCQVSVSNNQTLTVTGRLKTGADNKVYISDLNCHVA